MIRRGLSKSAGMMAASRFFSFGGRANTVLVPMDLIHLLQVLRIALDLPSNF